MIAMMSRNVVGMIAALKITRSKVIDMSSAAKGLKEKSGNGKKGAFV